MEDWQIEIENLLVSGRNKDIKKAYMMISEINPSDLFAFHTYLTARHPKKIAGWTIMILSEHKRHYESLPISGK